MTDELNPCGCCTTPDLTPVLFNRPGLPALSYRVATQPATLARMLAALTEVAQGTGLQPLTTRDLDDPAIAMLDAFAVLADVVSFYDERIANEGYLRTATERLSLLQLARQVGYELAPGVAASTYLSFTADSKTPSAAAATPANPATVDVPAGTPVQSIPAQGQTPQTFETSTDLKAKPEFNELSLRLTKPGTLDPTAKELALQGTATKLKPGDVLLMATADSGGNIAAEPTVVRALSVTEDATNQVTTVEVGPFATETSPLSFAPKKFEIARFGKTESFRAKEDTGVSVQGIAGTYGQGSWGTSEAIGLAEQNGWGWNLVDIALGVLFAPPVLPGSAGVFVLRQQAGVFGGNAPRYSTNLKPPWDYDWDGDPDGKISILTDSSGSARGGTDDVVYLDSSYPAIVPGSWVTFIDPTAGTRSFVIDAADHLSTADYAISGKTTALHFVDPPAWTQNPAYAVSNFKPRTTTAYAQSEALALAPEPNPDAITSSSIQLVASLSMTALAGQTIMISGASADLPGTTVSEAALVSTATLDTSLPATVLTLAAPLKYSYVPSTVTINANVVEATHGQTVASEVLGSSDGSANQSFTLNKPPLTYTPAAVASGAQSTLQIKVSGVAWTETPTLYQLGPLDRGYIVRLDDSGTTHVIFGDGIHGARPPAGTENIVATYRSGIGLLGMVGAGQLTLLPKRPLGITSVVNQLAAGGAADPETLADARVDAPLTTLTLDRIVSVSDYANFAAAFAAVGKAQATTLWAGQRQLVHLTVAGVGGKEFDNKALLSAAIQGAQDPGQLFTIDLYSPVQFNIYGDVLIDPTLSGADAAAAFTAVQAALADAFSFQARAFAQPVTVSEVVEVVMGVAGVIDTHISGLARFGETDQLQMLPASPAGWKVPGDPSSGTVGAELLTLVSTGAQITQRGNA